MPPEGGCRGLTVARGKRPVSKPKEREGGERPSRCPVRREIDVPIGLTPGTITVGLQVRRHVTAPSGNSLGQTLRPFFSVDGNTIGHRIITKGLICSRPARAGLCK